MPKTTPQLQTAFGTIMPLDPVVTSVMHGHHDGPSSGPNEDPHFAGRAVDVGAFGNVPVGMNPTTWNAITGAIMSEEFSRIGTIPQIAENAAMQQFAQEHGVILFDDPGTGPHVHFEVP